MKNVTEQKRLTVKQVATKLGVSVPRVHQLIQEGRLPAEKLGRDWIIETSDLEKLKLRPTGRPKKILESAPKDDAQLEKSEIDKIGVISVEKNLAKKIITKKLFPEEKVGGYGGKVIWMDSDGATAKISENQSGKGRRAKKEAAK